MQYDNPQHLLALVADELSGHQQRYQMQVKTRPIPYEHTSEIRFSGDDANAPWGSMRIGVRVINNRLTFYASYPDHPEVKGHYYPNLPSARYSQDLSNLSLKAVANRVARDVIEPAKPLVEAFAKACAENDRQQAAIPDLIAKYEGTPIRVRKRQGDPTVLDFTYRKPNADRPGSDVHVSGQIRHDGSVSIDRAWLDSEAGEAILKALAAL